MNRKKVLNVNVVVPDKIKKENQGKGAILNDRIRVDDPSMVMFSKEVVKLLLLPNSKDKFMQMKIKNAEKTALKEASLKKRNRKHGKYKDDS